MDKKASEKKAQYMKYGAFVSAILAAGIGSYTLYQSQKTEPVVEVSHRIEANTVLSPNDLKVVNKPVKGVYADAARSESLVVGKMTTIPIVADDQIRKDMVSNNNSLQTLANSKLHNGDVIISVPYKLGSMGTYIPPNTYVDLIAQSGNNKSPIVATHVKVVSNPNYEDIPVADKKNQSNSASNMFVQMPYNKYLEMNMQITSGSVQVMMISQQQALLNTANTNPIPGVSESSVNQNSDVSTTQTTMPSEQIKPKVVSSVPQLKGGTQTK